MVLLYFFFASLYLVEAKGVEEDGPPRWPPPCFALSMMANAKSKTSLFHPWTVAAENSELEKAQVIGMGDRHRNKKWVGAVSQLINLLGEDGDIVLLEGLAAGQKVDQKKYVVTNPITKSVEVMGFDDMEALKKCVELGAEYIAIEKSGVTDFPSFKRKLEISTEFNELIRRREERMATTILELARANPGKRIWFFAGSGHLVNSVLNTRIQLSGLKHQLLATGDEKEEASIEELHQHFQEQLKRGP